MYVFLLVPRLNQQDKLEANQLLTLMIQLQA